jgi:hypothetical protein
LFYIKSIFQYGLIFIKAEDRLEGASNFNAWKARVFNILEEDDLDELVTRVMEEPTSNAGRVAYKKRQTKAKRVIFYSVKDSMMSFIVHLRTTKECFDALANLYEKKAPTQKRTLKKQLHTLKMGNDETISAFFFQNYPNKRLACRNWSCSG